MKFRIATGIWVDVNKGWEHFAWDSYSDVPTILAGVSIDYDKGKHWIEHHVKNPIQFPTSLERGGYQSKYQIGDYNVVHYSVKNKSKFLQIIKNLNNIIIVCPNYNEFIVDELKDNPSVKAIIMGTEYEETFKDVTIGHIRLIINNFGVEPHNAKFNPEFEIEV